MYVFLIVNRCHSSCTHFQHFLSNFSPDFAHSNKCSMSLSASDYMFSPEYTSNECNRKPLSEFETWENEIYDSLYDCCRDKFPNYITSCCETPGSGGCPLSGVVQWLPDWGNGHCYQKVGCSLNDSVHELILRMALTTTSVWTGYCLA